MTANESLEDLMDAVEQITIGKTQEKVLYMKVVQVVRTGEKDDHTEMCHQISGRSIVDCLNKARSCVNDAKGISI